MAGPEVGMAPKKYARVGGLLYLFIIIAGGFGEGVVRNRVVVPGDAVATARNIIASQAIWRLAFGGELMLYVCGIALVLIFYVLLRPVNRNIALLAVFLNLVSLSLEAVNSLSHYAPLVILGGADYLRVFEPRQLQALAMLFLDLHTYAFGISLSVFSFVLLTLGYLIYNSGYFPKVLGVLLAVAAACYLTNSFALFFAPALEAKIFPAILLPPFIGESSLCLWLLIMGVDVPRWEERATRLIRQEALVTSRHDVAPASSLGSNPKNVR